MVPYAIYGICLFAGLFDRCNDLSVSNKSQCVGMFLDTDKGILLPRAWSSQINGFDTFGAALLSLFECLLEEGWMDKLYASIMIVGKDLQPRWPPPSSYNGVYFLFWMMFGFVLLRNLYVGVILNTFMTRDGTALLTVYLIIKFLM
jgi:hypothetical protein